MLGEDPADIERHWQRMYRGGPVLMSAIAGIDQALWDIKGKRFDAPVYELLGGPGTASASTRGSVVTSRPTSARRRQSASNVGSRRSR